MQSEDGTRTIFRSSTWARYEGLPAGYSGLHVDLIRGDIFFRTCVCDEYTRWSRRSCASPNGERVEEREGGKSVEEREGGESVEERESGNKV